MRIEMYRWVAKEISRRMQDWIVEEKDRYCNLVSIRPDQTSKQSLL